MALTWILIELLKCGLTDIKFCGRKGRFSGDRNDFSIVSKWKSFFLLCICGDSMREYWCPFRRGKQAGLCYALLSYATTWKIYFWFDFLLILLILHFLIRPKWEVFLLFVEIFTQNVFVISYCFAFLEKCLILSYFCIQKTFT